MFWQIYVVLVTAAIASALSAWIAARTVGMRGLPGCGEGSACTAIVTSRWSKVGKFSVAGVGAGVYAALTALVAFAICSKGQRERVEEAVLCVSLVPASSAVWFLFLQVAVIRRYCLYCNIVHFLGAIGLTFALLAIRPAPKQLFAAESIAGVSVALLMIVLSAW